MDWHDDLPKFESKPMGPRVNNDGSPFVKPEENETKKSFLSWFQDRSCLFCTKKTQVS